MASRNCSSGIDSGIHSRISHIQIETCIQAQACNQDYQPDIATDIATSLTSEARYRILADYSPDWDYWLGADGHFLYVSPACEAICGHPPQAFLNDPELFCSLLHPDDHAAWRHHVDDAGGNHAAHANLTLRLLDPHGNLVWLEHQCTPVFDQKGRYQGRRGVNRDITARMQAEAEIRKLSLAIEESPVSIMITDLDGRIEYVNSNLCSSSGYSRTELIGQNSRLLKSGLTSVATYRSLWTTLKAGQPWQGELINRRKNGEIYFEWERMTPIRQDGGKVTHYLAIKEDITARKRDAHELDRHRRHLEDLVAERTRELSAARDDANRASRAKSEFLANMSHEIRTPMNGILGSAQMLRRRVEDPQLHRLLDTLEASGKHLLGIINNILDLSKVEAGKLELESTPIDIDSIVTNVISMLTEPAAAKHLRLVTDTEMMPHDLLGDPTRLQQALLNYAANAIKFTDHGSVTLRTRKLSLDANSLHVHFEVSDTGIGIAPVAMDRLFQPFTQADNSITRKHGGSGLGLSITQKLAHLMGGKAGGNSRPGLGSTFWFTARLARSGQTESLTPPTEVAPETEADAEHILRRDFGGSAILLAEDEPITQEIAQDLLLNLGMRVDIASNGIHALDRFRNGGYALVLMDMQMPEMDGLEAAWRIRRLDNGNTVPIIAVTANAVEEDHRRCFAVGMNDILIKPYGPQDLVRMLLKHFVSTRKSA